MYSQIHVSPRDKYKKPQTSSEAVSWEQRDAVRDAEQQKMAAVVQAAEQQLAVVREGASSSEAALRLELRMHVEPLRAQLRALSEVAANDDLSACDGLVLVRPLAPRCATNRG